ncbi:ABC transporter permease [Tropicibacter sp. S64]|uniref:ABC transporter permease n=1 Tax=Tropicibacter sp. S64 TaxID=3415122 RepID=UPI003C7A8F06
MSNPSGHTARQKLPVWMQRIDPAIATSFFCILLILLLGSFFAPNFLSPAYIVQQLKVGAFLGIAASGVMLVILLGHIDLSIPWVLTAGAMMGCAAAGFGPVGAALAVPAGVLVGAGFGLINGIGVAYLRIPAMIVTLSTNVVAQGLMVIYSGGFSPQDAAPASMRWLATGFLVPGLPNAILVWALVGVALVFLLTRTAYGRFIYAIGNRESAAYLSGVSTRRVVLFTFVLAGALSALAGTLLAGYASKAAQAMGDTYLLPSIAAVVLGGTSILGGKGSYIGTVAGVILITLLQSILSVMQMPEAGRQMTYGLVILGMLLLYGRDRKSA